MDSLTAIPPKIGISNTGWQFSSSSSFSVNSSVLSPSFLYFYFAILLLSLWFVNQFQPPIDTLILSCFFMKNFFFFSSFFFKIICFSLLFPCLLYSQIFSRLFLHNNSLFIFYFLSYIKNLLKVSRPIFILYVQPFLSFFSVFVVFTFFYTCPFFNPTLPLKMFLIIFYFLLYSENILDTFFFYNKSQIVENISTISPLIK